jgi:exonuclease VII small subunit
MSQKRDAEDELKKLKRELQKMRTYLNAGEATFALSLLRRAETHLKKASDQVHRIDEA